jgi:hypothetical protein
MKTIEIENSGFILVRAPDIGFENFFYDISDENGETIDVEVVEACLEACDFLFEVGTHVKYTCREQEDIVEKQGLVSEVILLTEDAARGGKWAYKISSISGEIEEHVVREADIVWE